MGIIIDCDVSEFWLLADVASGRSWIFSDFDASSSALSFFYDFVFTLEVWGMADLIRHNTIFLIVLGIQDKSIFVEDHV